MYLLKRSLVIIVSITLLIYLSSSTFSLIFVKSFEEVKVYAKNRTTGIPISLYNPNQEKINVMIHLALLNITKYYILNPGENKITIKCTLPIFHNKIEDTIVVRYLIGMGNIEQKYRLVIIKGKCYNVTLETGIFLEGKNISKACLLPGYYHFSFKLLEKYNISETIFIKNNMHLTKIHIIKEKIKNVIIKFFKWISYLLQE